MRLHSFLVGVVVLTAAATLAAQPGIEIEGSGILGTEIAVHLTGDPGDFYLLYAGLLAQPTQSFTGQTLGIGPVAVPIQAGQFDATGRATFRIVVPVAPELVGKAMAFFQFETFRLRILPPGLVPVNVSPAAYLVVAPAQSGRPTTFAVEGTDSVVGSTVKLRMKAQPGHFVLAYYGNVAAPLVYAEHTVIGVVPPYPFTPFPSLMDAQGAFLTPFQIPDIPGLVGTNVCLQFQTFSLAGFPPQIRLEDSSCCLLFTVKAKPTP